MNRQIKFRGKRLDNGEWVYGDLLHYVMGEDQLVYTTSIKSSVLNHVDPKTVGQFTGLKDKDGNDIYEGDVTYHNRHDVKCVIKWADKFICFLGEQINHTTGHFMFYQSLDTSSLKILGNIHDNPELIS